MNTTETITIEDMLSELAAVASPGGEFGYNGRDIARRIIETHHAAVAAEREACAQIAEAPHRATRGGGPADPQRIAAAIRARGEATR